MTEGNIATVDLGTGSIRLTVFDRSGAILETRQCDNRCLYPARDWTEQDPAAWWKDLVRMCREVPPAVSKGIVAVSATGQREGIVPVDESFRPISNLITWLDRRTGEQAALVEKELGEEWIPNHGAETQSRLVPLQDTVDQRTSAWNLRFCL